MEPTKPRVIRSLMMLIPTKSAGKIEVKFSELSTDEIKLEIRSYTSPPFETLLQKESLRYDYSIRSDILECSRDFTQALFWALATATAEERE